MGANRAEKQRVVVEFSIRGDQYWISGLRRDGADRLYVSNIPVEIDADVKDEYFAQIRRRPERKSRRGERFL